MTVCVSVCYALQKKKKRKTLHLGAEQTRLPRGAPCSYVGVAVRWVVESVYCKLIHLYKRLSSWCWPGDQDWTDQDEDKTLQAMICSRFSLQFSICRALRWDVWAHLLRSAPLATAEVVRITRNDPKCQGWCHCFHCLSECCGVFLM